METDIEKQYERDLENFCDHGDIGDDWCGEEVVQAIITWIRNNVDLDQPIVDIGCGNASLLFQLIHLGYTDVSGVDQSPAAIRLANEISKQECASKVKLEVGDVLRDIPTDNEGSILSNKFQLILDKGLFDTITTSYKDAEHSREMYLNNTHKLLKSTGFLLIATCCHTEKQLKRRVANKGYNVLSVLPTPAFEFGGKKGHNVTVVAFRRKEA